MMLKAILKRKREELSLNKGRVPFLELEALAKDQPSPRSFSAALGKHGRKLKVIAELKRASPSRGVLCKEFNPRHLARVYEKAGASAISVLTDERFFDGKLKYLSLVRETTSLPLLRKDFIFDPYQLFEARCAGADAVLLIAGILGRERLAELLEVAATIDLECLVEVHTGAELEMALHAGSSVIGINNRDLHTFQVDPTTTARLCPLVPKGIPVVSESGIRSVAAAQKAVFYGVDAILVGEALVVSPEPGKTLEALRVVRGDAHCR